MNSHLTIPGTTDRFFIDGSWIKPSGTGAIEVENPATEQVFATVAAGTNADVDAAVAAARAAFPKFAAMSLRDRLALLEAFRSALMDRSEAIAQLVTAEMGSPINFSRAFHAQGAAPIIDSMIATARAFAFEHEIDGARIVHEPIGVVGLIIPWNAPIALLVGKMATAIAAGCTIVAKPSEVSPLSALLIAEAAEAAAFPPGVFNLVNGDGPGVGQRLAAHPDVDMVSLTGSTRAGVLVSQAAAPTIKRVHLELGGKSANILLPDADIASTVAAGLARCFVGSGQSCQAPTRMLVPRDRLDEAAAIAAEAARQFRAGDPQSSETTLGPVVNRPQFEKIQAMIDRGVKDGAILAEGGMSRPDGIERGYFVRPTVFSGVDPGSELAQEEIFGPVLSIIAYDTEEDAIAIANNSRYGLAGWVWSADTERARRVAAQMRTGRVYINGAPPVASAPFGGYKMSGNGRENGRFGLHEYLETKAVFE